MNLFIIGKLDTIIIYENNKEVNKYVLASERPKGWYKSIPFIH